MLLLGPLSALAEAAISFRSASDAAETYSTSLSIATPAATEAGDLLIAQIALRDAASISAPSGWSEIAQRTMGDLSVGLFYKIAQSGEPGSHTFSWPDNSAVAGGIAAYSGAAAKLPIGGVRIATGSGTRAQIDGLSTPDDRSLLALFTSFARKTTIAAPDGATERLQISGGPGANGTTTQLADMPAAAAGDAQSVEAKQSSRWIIAAVELGAEGQLSASFPGDYAWGEWEIGENVSDEQRIAVASDAPWGIKISSDLASGRPERWDGSQYLPAALSSPLRWRVANVDGAPAADPYQAISSTPEPVISGHPKTDQGMVSVGLRYRQDVGYGDQADIGSDRYRIRITFDAAQGF